MISWWCALRVNSSVHSRSEGPFYEYLLKSIMVFPLDRRADTKFAEFLPKFLHEAEYVHSLCTIFLFRKLAMQLATLIRPYHIVFRTPSLFDSEKYVKIESYLDFPTNFAVISGRLRIY